MNSIGLTAADVAYVRANFRPLAEVCAERGEQVEQVRALIRTKRLPAPSYLLPAGTEMVPAALPPLGGGGRRAQGAAGGAPPPPPGRGRFSRRARGRLAGLHRRGLRHLPALGLAGDDRRQVQAG